MQYIVLDIVQVFVYPRLLGLNLSEMRIVIPENIQKNFSVSSQKRQSILYSIFELVNNAIQEGFIRVIEANNYVFKNIQSTSKLDNGKVSVIAAALSIKNRGDNVKIATFDQQIIQSAQKNGVEVMSSGELHKLLDKFPSKSLNSLQEAIVAHIIRERKYVLNSLLVGVLVAVIGVLLARNLQTIISTINIWGTLLLVLFLGIALFVFREKRRLSYGILEFLVGIIAIIALFMPEHFSFNALHYNLDLVIKLLGGLYIMVRGQDNIVKSLSNTKIGYYLKDNFGIG